MPRPEPGIAIDGDIDPFLAATVAAAPISLDMPLSRGEDDIEGVEETPPNEPDINDPARPDADIIMMQQMDATPARSSTTPASSFGTAQQYPRRLIFNNVV